MLPVSRTIDRFDATFDHVTAPLPEVGGTPSATRWLLAQSRTKYKTASTAKIRTGTQNQAFPTAPVEYLGDLDTLVDEMIAIAAAIGQ